MQTVLFMQERRECSREQGSASLDRELVLAGSEAVSWTPMSHLAGLQISEYVMWTLVSVQNQDTLSSHLPRLYTSFGHRKRITVDSPSCFQTYLDI